MSPSNNRSERKYKVATIPGDGIGLEVVPEGMRVIEAAATPLRIFRRVQTFRLELRSISEDGPHDAGRRPATASALRRYFSRCGWLSRSAGSHLSVGAADSDSPRFPAIRQPSPHSPASRNQSGRYQHCGGIDFCVVRENNEGEYSNIGGRLYSGTEDEMAVQQTVFTRKGCDRVMRFAFELARTRKRHVTSATKSNGIIYTMPFWDERFRGHGQGISRRAHRSVSHRYSYALISYAILTGLTWWSARICLGTFSRI